MLSISKPEPETTEYTFGVEGVWTAEQVSDFLGVTIRSLWDYVSAGSIMARRLPSATGDGEAKFHQRRFCVRSVKQFVKSLESPSDHDFDYDFGVDGLMVHDQVCNWLEVSSSYLTRLVAGGARLRMGRIGDGRIRRYCVRSVREYLAGLPE